MVGTNVCRISGLLPNGGCDRVDVVNRDGQVETRSMVYTDYFVKGSQPTAVCPLHEKDSFLDTLAGMFGKDSDQPPIAVDAAGLPDSGAAATRTSGAAAAGQPVPADGPAAAEQPKKRGFWSRVFGGGGDKDKRQEEEKKKEEERKKPGIK